MIDVDKASALSEAEAIHWHRFCQKLEESILLARMAGRRVVTDVQPDYVVPQFDGNLIGVMTGRTCVNILF